MTFPISFGQNFKIVPGCRNTAGNAASTADRVSLENYAGVAILFTITQGGADAASITWHKSTTAAGGTEDTTNAILNYWTMEDVTIGTTADTWTKGTAVAAGSVITTSATGSGVSYYLIDIKADELPDSTAEYKFVEAYHTGDSAAGNLYDIIYILYGPRYGQASLPSAQS